MSEHHERKAELVFPLVELPEVIRAESDRVRFHADIRLHDARVLKGEKVRPFGAVKERAHWTCSSLCVSVMDLTDLELGHSSLLASLNVVL